MGPQIKIIKKIVFSVGGVYGVTPILGESARRAYADAQA